MSTIGSYPTRTFKESQKFLVLDPETQSTSLVLGRDLVEYITPQSTYVFAEQSRAVAQNEDYQIGALIQTAGDLTAGDNFAGTLLVVPGGGGDFPMANGNDLLIIKGDILLREQLASFDFGLGSSLIAHTSTSDTVTEALDKRTIYVGSVAELLSAGVLDGAHYSVSEYRPDNGFGGGDFIYDANRPKSDHDGVLVVDPLKTFPSDWSNSTQVTDWYTGDGIGSGCFVRIMRGSVDFEISGLVAETSVSATSQHQVMQQFFDAIAGYNLTVNGHGKYGTNDSILAPSDTVLRFNNTEIFDNGNWVANEAPNFNYGFIIRQAKNTHIHGLIWNGNNAAYGGRRLDPPYSGSRGMIIWDGTESCSFVDCKSNNSQTNAFSIYAGGANDTSRNCSLVRCTADNAGVGMGQEIWSVVSTAGTAVPGPENVTYDHCEVTDSLLALFLSGGTCTVDGGYYEAVQQMALTGSPGDAAEAHLVNQYTLNGVRFKQTGGLAAGNIVRVVARPPASTLPTYGNNTRIQMEFNGCRFEQVADNGPGVLFYQGGDIQLNNCTFEGPGVLLSHRTDTFQPDGNFYEGLVSVNGGVFRGFGSETTGFDYAIDGDRPMVIRDARFLDPKIANMDGVRLNNDSIIELENCTFGDPYSTVNPRLAVNGSGVTFRKLVVKNCRDEGLTTGWHNLTDAQKPVSYFSDNTPASTIDRRRYYRGSGAPTTGTWEQGDIIWNVTPNGGSYIGWVCVVSGTPGTWRQFGAILS